MKIGQNVWQLAHFFRTPYYSILKKESVAAENHDHITPHFLLLVSQGAQTTEMPQATQHQQNYP